MDRVLGVFINLEPVAMGGYAERNFFHPVFQQRIKLWKGRNIPGWPHIGKDDTFKFMGWIGPLDHTTMQRAFLRFRPGLYQGPVNVIMPAVIATDQTMFCDNAIFKGCPTMDAVFVEKAEITGFIPKQDQVFPQQGHRLWQVPKF